MITILQVILLVSVGVAASISDLKNGKISNRLILAGSLTSIILDAFYYGLYDRSAFGSFAWNAALVIAVALVLYGCHVWAGGDCKLMIFLAFSVPYEMYWEVNGSRLTLMLLYVAQFFLAFLYIMVDTVRQMRTQVRQAQIKAIGKSLVRQIVSYLRMLVYLWAFSQLYMVFVNPRIPEHNFVIFFFASMAFALALRYFPYFDNTVLLVMLIAFDVIMTSMTGYIAIGTRIRNYVLIVLFMLIQDFANLYNYQQIPTEQAAKGMVLSRAQSIQFQQSRVNGLPGISDETLKSRITREEAASIHRWKNSKMGRSQITIVRKIPFALFMTIGTVIYMVTGRVF